MNGERPDIKIVPAKADRYQAVTARVLLLINLVFAGWLYYSSPAIIPGHFDADGHITRYDNKAVIIIMPVIAVFIFALLSILTRYPRIYNYPSGFKKENAEAYYRSGIRLLRLVNVGIQVLFFLIQLEFYSGIKNNYLPMSWWELPVALLLTVGLPIFISLRFFKKNKQI